MSQSISGSFRSSWEPGKPKTTSTTKRSVVEDDLHIFWTWKIYSITVWCPENIYTMQHMAHIEKKRLKSSIIIIK